MYFILLDLNRVPYEPGNQISCHSACKTWPQHNPEDGDSVSRNVCVHVPESVVWHSPKCDKVNVVQTSNLI
jgi:hypothetical protein